MLNIGKILENVNGASFVGLDTEVVVPLKGGKANPMKDRVTKVTYGSRVMVFQNRNANGYENMVHRRLAEQLRQEAAEKAAEAKNLLAHTLTEAQLDELGGSIDSFLEKAEHISKAKELFKLSPRKWGTRIPNTPIIEHTPAKRNNKEFYLEVIFMKAGKSLYYLDGQPIAEDLIIGLEKPTPNPNAQGGLENQVIIRTYNLASISKIRFGGKEYEGPFTYGDALDDAA